MSKKQKLVIVLLAAIIAGTFLYFTKIRPAMRSKNVKQIELNGPVKTGNDGPLNLGDVNPITGIACENWNKRFIAAMQPADVSARPAAGFSEADMVFEMPVFTGSNTRLMGVYGCTIPDDIGSLRSARHDYLPLAKGLDAIYIHWGYSKFAETLLGQKILENIDCMTTSFCGRWEQSGKMKYEDTGHITKAKIEEAINKFGYSTENKFSGYPHQEETPIDQRPSGGNLRVAYINPYDVEYDYDKESNSYLRTWDDEPDTDKNNKKRIAPKNIVAMFAESEQIKLSTDYKARGVQDPWQLVPEEERAGLNDIPGAPGIGRYNNLQIGDPWFDTSDSGDAYFYMNGKETKGKWKKDKSKLDSKLFFYDDSGKEIMFVPGQIWVEVLEPGQVLRWTPAA